MKQVFTHILVVLCLIWGSVYGQDARVTSVTNLDLTNCSIYSQGVTLGVQYSNSSTVNIPIVPLSYSLSGGTPVAEVNTVALPGNGTDTYDFTALLSLPNPSSAYTLKIWTAVPGDLNPTNDTLTINFISPGLNNLPFTETFENFTPQSSPAAPGILNNGWTRSSTNNETWHVANNTTPSFATGPNANHTPQGSVFMFTESSGTVLGDVMKLNSPCIDLGGTNGPRLSFWYHMFGSNMGTLELHVISNNDTTLAWQLTGQQQTANGGPWLEAIVDLSTYAGQIIELEFRGTIGNGFNSDMAIDDIFLFDPAPVDPGVVEIITPNGPTCYGPNETITVNIQNLGSAPLDFVANPVTVGAQITGSSTATFSVVEDTGVLPIFGTREVTITTNADLSTIGPYTLKAFTTTAADPNAFNDTTTVPVQNLPVTLGGLTEDFETFSVGFPGILVNNFTRTNTNNVNGWFVRAGPTPTFNTGPNQGNSAIGTRYVYLESASTNAGEEYELATPCVDMSATTAPKLKFFYHMFGSDIGTLDVFVRSGSFNTNVFSISGQQQGGSAAPYDSATIDLTPFQNDVFQVVFRVTTIGGGFGDIAIDDINIFEPPAIDVQALDILSPESSCGLSANEPVIISLVNVGRDTLVDVEASFNPDNTGFVPSEAVPGPIAPGDTVIYTFNSTANFSAAGPHTLEVSVNNIFPPDQNPGNNIISSSFLNFGSTPTTLPYFENFENGPGGWNSGGLNNSWAFGTPAKRTIIGASSGSNAWVTGGLGTQNYNDNEGSFVLAPCFDFSGVVVPIIEFDIWWNAEFSFDGALLESSTDGGLTWQRVGELNDPVNWYNDNTITGLQNLGYNNNFSNRVGWTGRGNGTFGPGSGGWVTASHELTGLGGIGSVLLRVSFGSDFIIADDGFAFDDVRVFEKPPINAEATRLASPSGGCGYSDQTPVSMEYTNVGTQDFDTLVVSYRVNGGPISTDTTVNLLQPGDTIIHVFSQTADMSNLTVNYDVDFWLSLVGDTATVNDSGTISLTPVSIPTVTQYPYVEDFENGQGGWNSEGIPNNFGNVLNSWAFGYPNKNTIRGAASDSNAWVTGGLGPGFFFNNEQSFVISPCLDLSDLTNPQISMNIWWNCPFSSDGAVLQASTDGGVTWENVGNFNDPFNWFNDNTIFGNPGGQQIGWTGRGNGTFGPGSGGWVNAKNALAGLGGESLVRLRVAFGASGFGQDDGFAFDDVFIWDRANDDMASLGFQNLPRTFCNNDNAPIELEIRNDGLLTQGNFPVQVIISGPGGTDTLTQNFSPPLAPDGTAVVNFGTYSNLVGGQYSIIGYPMLANDTTAFNDTTFDSFQINVITTAPTGSSDSICSAVGSQFTLLAQAADTTVDLKWFDAPVSGSLVAEGDTFRTPFLASSQTFYVEASNSESFGVGPITGSFVGTGTWDVSFNEGLNFDVEEAMVLESVRVFPEVGSSGIIRVLVTNPNIPAFNRTAIFNFGGSVIDTTLTLNFEIPVGDDFLITASGTNLGTGNGLFRNFSGATYPYSVPGVVAITGNTITFNNTRYYYFYDWKIRTLGCPSPRTPIDAVLLTPPTVNLGLDGAFCGSYTIDASDPSASSYQWFQDGQPYALGPLQTIDTSGLYSIEVFNGVGCNAEDSVVLTINPAPEVEIGSDTSSCDPILLQANTMSNASYFWFSTFPDDQDSAQVNYTAKGSGTYILTVNALGCTAKDTVDVNILPGPPLNLGMDRTTCSDVTLDAGTGTSYLWSTGDTTQTLTLNAPFIPSDTVSVQVTSLDGCVGADTLIVSQGQEPIIKLADSLAACDNITLNAGDPNLTYIWNTGETTQSIVADSTGIYTVTGTNSDGCVVSKDVKVEILETPDALATYNVTGNGFTVDFVNLSTPIDSSTTFLWSFNDGTGSTSTAQNPTYTFAFSATYQVTLEVTNDCGTDVFKLLVTTSSSIDYLDERISIYPNPTTGEFFISGDDLRLAELQIEVSDLRGKEIYKHHQEKLIGNFKQKVDLSEQPKGVYLIKISDGNREVFRRIIKR